MSELAKVLPDEVLTGKWRDMLDWPKTRYDRVLVQNYATGRLKLIKSAQIQLMTDPVRDGNGHEAKLIAPPIWRRVNADEAEELWRAEVYLQYCQNRSVRERSDYNKHNGIVGGITKELGGTIPDSDLIEDPRLKGLAREAQTALERREEAAKHAKHYAEYGGMVNVTRTRSGKAHFATTDSAVSKFLREYVAPLRAQRDVDQLKKREAHVFQQEQMRERARQAVLGKTPAPVAAEPSETEAPKLKKRRGRPPKKKAEDELESASE